MTMYPVRILWMALIALGLSGCAKYDFAPSPVDALNDPAGEGPATAPDWGGGEAEETQPPANSDPSLLASVNMKLGKSQATFQQDSYDQNETSITFQVVDTSGNYVNDLDPSQLVVTENGRPITGFSLTNTPMQTHQVVDMALMVDVTCSMKPTINSAKATLINFINNTRAAGYHTRICLITFGDYVVKSCDRFYNNDPKDPATMTEVAELTAMITNLQAGCGAADPGGPTLDENPISALIDAAKAPWAAGSQRFGILLTDAGFLYAPGNDVGLVKASTYSEALQALASSQMNLFLAAPNKPGYNQSFGGQSSMVGASKGEFFLYSDLVNGNVTLSTILNRIMQRVQTTYKLTYVADLVPGLDPALPLDQRQIEVKAPNGTVVQVVNTTSTLPQGHPQYTRSWILTSKQIISTSVVVRVNGQMMTTGYQIKNGQVVFDQVPPKGAHIQVEFVYALIKDALNMKNVVLPGNTDIANVKVLLNDMLAHAADYSFEKNLSGQWVLRLADTALAEADPYQIRAHGGLDVKIMK